MPVSMTRSILYMCLYFKVVVHEHSHTELGQESKNIILRLRDSVRLNAQ